MPLTAQQQTWAGSAAPWKAARWMSPRWSRQGRSANAAERGQKSLQDEVPWMATLVKNEMFLSKYPKRLEPAYFFSACAPPA